MLKLKVAIIVVISMLFSQHAVAKPGGPSSGAKGNAHSTKGTRSHHSAKGRSVHSGFRSTHISLRAKNRNLRVHPSDDHMVSAYYKKNGTFVSAYHAKNPNETRNDNYSTKGNINPYSGVEGTKPRDGAQ